jgi:hypothetical protein
MIRNNPGLLRLIDRQNEAEQGATAYLKRIVEKQRIRAQKRASRCRNPYTNPRNRK